MLCDRSQWLALSGLSQQAASVGGGALAAGAAVLLGRAGECVPGLLFASVLIWGS